MAAEVPERLFIGVGVPWDSLEACQSLIDQVRLTSYGRAARWVPMANLHLTIRFLGDTPPDVVPDVALAVLAAAATVEPFRVELAGAGAFPDGRHPRTIWLGVDKGNDGLIRIIDALEAPLDSLGWAPDARSRRPHLTVARTDALRGDASHAIADSLAHASIGWRTGFEATTLTLFRSHLGGGGPRYEPIVEAPLGA
jgi:RNA 2',3'-cyclic 3'-phosphodiesterase